MLITRGVNIIYITIAMVYPVFSGPYYQRGYGAPHLWLRRLKPLVKSLGMKALKHGVKLGKRIYHDMTSGKSFKDSFKQRSMQSLRDMATSAPGADKSVIKRRKTTRSVRKVSYPRHANNAGDIFDT